MSDQTVTARERIIQVIEEWVGISEVLTSDERDDLAERIDEALFGQQITLPAIAFADGGASLPTVAERSQQAAELVALRAAAEDALAHSSEIREASWMEMARGGPGLVVGYRVDAAAIDALRAACSGSRL